MPKRFPSNTNLKTVNITYQTPSETLEGTPITLPNTEPGTPQVSLTLASGHFPTYDVAFYSVKHIAVVYGAGKFVTAGTLSWRMIKNGTSVRTGTQAVAANTFFTMSSWFLDVVVGDILKIAFWSDQADSNYDYNALFVYPTRPMLYHPARFAIKNLAIVSPAALKPVLTLGSPTAVNSNYPIYGQATGGFTAQWVSGGGGTQTVSLLAVEPTYGIYRFMYYGDMQNADNAVFNTHASQHPRYWANWYVSKVSGRGFKIDSL